MVVIGALVWASIIIKDDSIDFLYQNNSPTQQVVKNEQVDHSNFVLTKKIQNNIDKNKKSLIMDTVVSLSGGSFITKFICFIMFLKLLQLGYEAPSLPQAEAQLPGVNGVFMAPDIPATKPNYRTGSVSSRPKSLTVRSESELDMQKPEGMEQEVYNNIPKAIKRQLPDPQGRDRVVNIPKLPTLDLPFNQISFKEPKHFYEIMKVAGLCPDPNLTQEKRALMFCDYIFDTLTDPKSNLECYSEGQYQGGCPLGYDSINVLDSDTGITITFKKYRNNEHLGNKNGFTTVFLPSNDEIENLRNTGNLLTEEASKKYGVPLQLNSPESSIIDKNNE